MGSRGIMDIKASHKSMLIKFDQVIKDYLVRIGPAQIYLAESPSGLLQTQEFSHYPICAENSFEQVQIWANTGPLRNLDQLDKKFRVGPPRFELESMAPKATRMDQTTLRARTMGRLTRPGIYNHLGNAAGPAGHISHISNDG